VRGWRQKCIEYPNIMFGRALINSRKRASKKGLNFDIDKEFILNLFDKQGGKCFYSGVSLNIVKEDSSTFHDPLKMTLDCIDPKLGYTRGNVVWCAYCVNAFKQKMPANQMFEICKGIIKTSCN
jgi:hypothetical protein